MILALHAAGARAHLWLYDAASTTEPLAEMEWESGRQLSGGLLTHIKDLLASRGAQIHDLAGVVVFSGPGSFTSLRIGHTVANALADGVQIPVVGARGEDWLRTGLAAVADAKPGHPALPHYGSAAHITKPKS
jgi:tRNA threonylcarbamoyladenosine biosynthesis protein TsaB